MNKYIHTLIESLTEEQREKASACKSMDELMKFVSEEKIELPDEVAGGYIYHSEKEDLFYLVTDDEGKHMVDPDTNKMLVFDDFLQAVLHAIKYGVSADVIDYIQLKELKKTGKITSKYSGS